MRRLVIVLIVCSFLSLQLSGCETMGWTEKGAITGAAGGAIIGAILGEWKGAAMGALSGAVIGAVIGHYYDRQVMARAEAVNKYNYGGREENLEIEDSTIKPQRAIPESTVEATVLYLILTPDETKNVKITEIRTFVNGNVRLELSRREVVRSQGSHLSTMKFTLPRDLAKGDYTLITTISDGKQTKTAKSPLKVI